MNARSFCCCQTTSASCPLTRASSSACLYPRLPPVLLQPVQQIRDGTMSTLVGGRRDVEGNISGFKVKISYEFAKVLHKAFLEVCPFGVYICIKSEAASFRIPRKTTKVRSSNILSPCRFHQMASISRYVGPRVWLNQCASVSNQ